MMKPEPNELLHSVRLGKGLSRKRLAEAIGTSQSSIGRWERGESLPSLSLRAKLCAFLQMSPEELGFPSVASLEVFSTQGKAIYDPAIPLQPSLHLSGRDEILYQLKQHLCAEKSGTAVAINGLPGVGKTALAITLVHDHEIHEYFPDGLLWAGLGPNPNLLELLSRWGKLLGIATEELSGGTGTAMQDAWSSALRSAIGGRRMLFVLDDVWHIDEAMALKVGGPDCAYLLTTRFPIISAYFSINAVFPVHELSTEQSLSLLQYYAPVLVETEPTRMSELVTRVGGLPLSLTLIGSYLRKYTSSNPYAALSSILSQLSHVKKRVLNGDQKVSPEVAYAVQFKLQSIIEVMELHLEEPLRRALSALSVFPAKPHSFSEAAALAVAECSLEVLDGLTDTGLLECCGPGRYTLHQSIADYAHVRSASLQSYNRLIQYAIEYAEAYEQDYERLEGERGIILAALETAHELGKPKELVRGICAFAPFLLMRGLYTLVELYLQRARSVAQEMGEIQALSAVLYYLGEVAFKRGEVTQAETYYLESVKLARWSAASEWIAMSLAGLGRIYWLRGNYVQAELYSYEALEAGRKIGHVRLICSILNVLGAIAAGRGDYEQAEAFLEEGLEKARLTGNSEQICQALSSVGAINAQRGLYIEAEVYLREGLALARRINHRELICLLLLNLGSLASEQGKYGEAEHRQRDALELARVLGRQERIGQLLINLASVLCLQEKYEESERLLQEGLQLAQQIGAPQLIAFTLYEYGNCYLHQMRIEEAERCFHEMQTVSPEESRELLALAQYGLSQVALTRHDMRRAYSLGEQSALVLEMMKHHHAREVRRWLDSIGIAVSKEDISHD